MLKAFECPACAAPLEFDGGMMQGFIGEKRMA